MKRRGFAARVAFHFTATTPPWHWVPTGYTAGSSARALADTSATAAPSPRSGPDYPGERGDP